VDQGVAEQVGKQLRDAAAVAMHRLRQIQIGLDSVRRKARAQLRNHMIENLLERQHRAVQGDATAEPAAREIQQIVDQRRHPRHALLHQREDRCGIPAAAHQQIGAGRDRRQRVAQVVAEHGDKLLAQFGSLAFPKQPRFTGGDTSGGVQMRGDQFGKQLEHADGLRRVQPRRPRIDRAQRAEERPVGEHDRHRDIALEAVLRRRVVTAKGHVVGDTVDDDGLTALPDLVTNGGFDFELAAGRQAERDLVAHRATNPSLFGDTGNGRKPHTGRAADHFQNSRNRRDTLHGSNVRAVVGGHHAPFNVP
jgi:hypothetical protein